MAEITLKLRHDPRTGERVLVIHYESDDDALAHEHERDHRAMVEAILGVPLGTLADTIVVERVGKAEVAAELGETAPARQAEALGEGGSDHFATRSIQPAETQGIFSAATMTQWGQA